MNRKLALGHQEFSELINNNCIYVDKTEDIFKLITSGSYYFLSRPRRFGKSLLANTIKELFLGNKELFKGLWIYDKWDWGKTYPVIKISFSNIDYEKLGLQQAISFELDNIANKYNIKLVRNSVATKFKELIEKLSGKTQVAIIIDEYDKPIIDYLDKIEKAEENRNILKNFYSVLKDADKYLRFIFITGVSKFSQVSIFSDLNNLIDITIDKNYPQIVGWTQKEIEENFPGYIKRIKDTYKNIFPDIMLKVKEWYNGYSWDGFTRVYNPVSLMNFFSKQDFRNYWFATGTPTFLMEIIKEKKLIAYDVEHTYTTAKILDSYDFKNINLDSLLFQTGYLTIKEYDLATGEITLGYPNKEIDDSFSTHFLAEFTTGAIDVTEDLLHRIRRCFMKNDMEELIEHINTLFANIPYNLIEKTERYFHSLFYLVLKIIGFTIDAEILTIKGRIDAVVKTNEHIFIVEFKINQSAKKAIRQIIDKKYASKYLGDKRKIILLGINFDTENKSVDDYEVMSDFE